MGKADERFAARTKRERERRGWRQEDLAIRVAAEGLSLHATAFSKIEAGQRAVSLDDAVCIAAAFDVPLTYLLLSDDPGVIARELEEVQAGLAQAQAESDDALHRAAALWNRKQELIAALELERGGHSPAG